jgi:hypothetical protein
MQVAYVFSTSGHTASDKRGHVILPQLEQERHDVASGEHASPTIGPGHQGLW